MTEPTQPDPLDTRPVDPTLSSDNDNRAVRKADNRTLGMAIAIAMIAGVVIGAALDNIGMWIAISVGVGVAIGVGLNQNRNAARKPK